MWRRYPPVLSPVTTRALVDGMGAAIGLRGDSHAAVEAILRYRYGATDALLTDSGTSALILALRKMLPRGGTVAYPAYACIDLTAAAVATGVRVRLYDLDPATMSPDLDSLRATIKRGADAIVVAHLYGYPADMAGVRKLAAEQGMPVIEDAAQGAGGTLNGERLGSLGDVAILSFGRGKGTTGGKGGAVLVRTPALTDWTRRTRTELKPGSRGGVTVLSLAAQRVLSHPSLYRLPSSIPSLRLGEMVYLAPHPPLAMSGASAGVLRWTLGLEEREVADRRARAREVLSHMHDAPNVTPVRPIAGSEPGFLRLACLDSDGTLRSRPDLGALRGYPMTLDEHTQLRALLLPGERAGKGSQFLRDRLFTVPTHSHVDQTFFAGLAEWLEAQRPELHGIAALS
ncbi:MAG TPA: DegT/DnrJ/EryC1/StrS family aminotransferase [Gemmatimonadaceae bacterium]|nr:DegT/DnrJ/EryC1/StrS family aminotransferase [Gemmatimonadaceae bacterium]